MVSAGKLGDEFRNSLQAVTSSVYLTKEEVKTLSESSEKENFTESLETIEDQVTYINKIVSDMQDFVTLRAKNRRREPAKAD